MPVSKGTNQERGNVQEEVGPISNSPPSITPSWTFTVWLAFQETRKDKVGEPARTVREDPARPGWRTIEGLEQYYRQHQFSSSLIAALKPAWDE